MVAVTNPKEGPYTFTEKDFASFALEKVLKDKEEGKTSPGGVLYAASKTAADRAVWKFRDEHKVSITHSLPECQNINWIMLMNISSHHSQ